MKRRKIRIPARTAGVLALVSLLSTGIIATASSAGAAAGDTTLTGELLPLGTSSHDDKKAAKEAEKAAREAAKTENEAIKQAAEQSARQIKALIKAAKQDGTLTDTPPAVTSDPNSDTGRKLG